MIYNINRTLIHILIFVILILKSTLFIDTLVSIIPSSDLIVNQELGLNGRWIVQIIPEYLSGSCSSIQGKKINLIWPLNDRRNLTLTWEGGLDWAPLSLV